MMMMIMMMIITMIITIMTMMTTTILKWQQMTYSINQTLALHPEYSGGADLRSSRWHVVHRRLSLHWLGS